MPLHNAMRLDFLTKRVSAKNSSLFFVLAHYMPIQNRTINTMADIDFLRFSALVLATTLIGKSADPIREAVDMAEDLLNKLNEKEV